MSNYESWRISYQSSEAAARSAWQEMIRLHHRVNELEAQLSAIGAGGVEPLRKQAVRRAPAAPVPQWDGKINPADFNVETFRRSGNSWLVKPDNCVRITHVPTGLFEEGVSERSIHTNKAEAWERLSARLEALAAELEAQLSAIGAGGGAAAQAGSA